MKILLLCLLLAMAGSACRYTSPLGPIAPDCYVIGGCDAPSCLDDPQPKELKCPKGKKP